MNKSNRFKAIFYALALVIFGGVIGYLIKSTTTANPQTLRLGREDEIAAVIRERLNSKLELTAEQKSRLEPLIKKTAQEMEASHLDCLKRINKAIIDLHTEIRPELISEQQAKLADLEKERSDRMLEKYNYRETASTASPH